MVHQVEKGKEKGGGGRKATWRKNRRANTRQTCPYDIAFPPTGKKRREKKERKKGGRREGNEKGGSAKVLQRKKGEEGEGSWQPIPFPSASNLRPLGRKEEKRKKKKKKKRKVKNIGAYEEKEGRGIVLCVAR